MRNIKVIESWLNVQKANCAQKNLINVMVIVMSKKTWELVFELKGKLVKERRIIADEFNLYA